MNVKNKNGNIFYKTLQSIIDWAEQGDLILLIVMVSAVHFAYVLADYDYWPVAVALGLLVDLGIYRTVRYAVRYQGASKAERIARYAIAGAMTAVSYVYHLRFYGDPWLAAPVPFLIAVLAWLDRRKYAEKPARMAQDETHEENDVRYVCVSCGASYESQQGLAAHSRKHLREKTNGKVKV